MKNRIASIMDTTKKKAGLTLFGGALILTLGAGLVLAANGGAIYPAADTPYPAPERLAAASSSPAHDVSIVNAPIDLTFIKQEVPIIDQLNRSGYRALYMDAATQVRVTRTGAVQVSVDQGAVWQEYPVDEISAAYMTDWLAQNDPIPDGVSRRAMLEKINSGAKIVHAAFPEGKEMYVIIGDAEAQIELCTPDKLVSALIDGQRLMLTDVHAPVQVSPPFLQAFYDFLVANGILTPAEAEQDYEEKLRYLEENGFVPADSVH
jgi:hypothetical protein